MRLARRTLLTVPAALLVLAPLRPSPARAATQAAFTRQAFAQAQQAGKPILVHVWASWCPTCARQAPLLKQLAAEPGNKDLTVLTVNFDTQKDVVKQFGVRTQSTLIAFRGKTEVGRSIGDTDTASIQALIARAEH